MDEIETAMEDQAEQKSPFSEYIESVNLAEKLDEEELKQIGDDAKKGFDSDRRSRGEWENRLDQWTRLAKQVIEEKAFPWPGASNVKFPLLSTAAMQFAARAYPSLVPSDGRVVKAKVIGMDFDGTKTKTAEAVSIYMSYQLMEEMKGWEEDMDKLLIMLPIVGTLFKKTYWDPMREVNCSKLVLPKNLVVDNWARCLEDAERVSEILYLNPREVEERIRAKLWLDVDLPAPTLDELEEDNDNETFPDSVDETTPSMFVEQHTWLDLDDDGLKEPYIVTFHHKTAEVMRIVARFDEDGMILNDEGEVIRFEPIYCYTKFGFVPNPDGSFYDIGFGVLLGPLNESVNTLINQLVDAGTLNNMQSGFIGKGLRLRMGETRFNVGEWKVVNSTGDDLKKQIVPLPSKEPSKVLFELMGALIQSGKELASVAEIFTGKMPGQNTPATTTMATVEQGMKVFTAVYKRIFRSLSEEFLKLYKLNSKYLNPHTYSEVVGMEISPDDFDPELNRVFPGADPTAVSQNEKLMKAQGLFEMMANGLPLDPIKVMIRMLEAQEQPNWQELIPQDILQSGQMPPPPPDPKMMEMQMKGQLEQQKMQMQGAQKQQEMELNARDSALQLQMKEAEHAQKMQHEQEVNQVKLAEAQHKQAIFAAEQRAKAVQGVQHREVEHQQKMRQGEENAKQKAAQQKNKPAKKPSKGT
jgi:chaperonin GroES